MATSMDRLGSFDMRNDTDYEESGVSLADDSVSAAISVKSTGDITTAAKLMPMNNIDSAQSLKHASTLPKQLKKQQSKRERREEKKWLKKLKQIGKQHPEFELTYDLLLGIRTSVSLINNSVIRSSQHQQDSSDEDDEELERQFKDTARYYFPSDGSTQTPPHKMNDFELKDYCRHIFSTLREWFGIKPEEYLVKLCGGFNLLEFISNSKSGQFFFYSYEGTFLIKSMTRSECHFLRKILPDYFHYVQRQPHTLLTRFYGMYRVKAHNRQPIYFVIMGNVFDTDLDIHKIYDLKGSTHGRVATQKDRENDVPVLKDLDFLSERQTIHIGKAKAKLFRDQLRRDCELLRKLNIMDYSLLLGIHYKDRKSSGQAQQSNRELLTRISTRNLQTAQPLIIPPTAIDELKETDVALHQSDTPATPRSVSDSFSEDMSEEKDGMGELPQKSPIGGPNTLSQKQLGIPLKRIPSRRLSQIGVKSNYVVKIPLQQKFDMPELIDDQRLRQKEEDKGDTAHNPNMFYRYHGGITYVDEEGNMPSNEVYLFGIIDILQKYNKRKKVESFFRGLQTDQSTISAVPPEVYSKRMCDFLREKVF